MADKKPRVELNPVDPLFIDRPTVAAVLGVSATLLDSMDKNGLLGPQSVRFGGSVRWNLDELRRWAAAGSPPRQHWQAIEQNRRQALRFAEIKS